MASSGTYYHGIRDLIPFEKFNPRLQGYGAVSGGIPGSKNYGGFFFTSSLENAAFYGEHWVCKVFIDNIESAPEDQKHPPTTMKLAAEKGVSMKIEDVLDGAVHSDIIVVPINAINKIKIVDWIFVGEKEFWYELLDEMFAWDDDETVEQHMIKSFCSMVNIDINYLLKIPEFKEYYNSKENSFMEVRSQIRKAIRQILKEELEGNFDGEQSFEDLIKNMDSSQNNLKDRLSAMQKQYNIPVHNDTEINQMLKKVEKEKMQHIEDEIENSKKQEEKIKKTKEEYLAMKKAKEERDETMNQVTSLQTQSQTPSSIASI